MGLIAPIVFWLTYSIMAGLRPEYSFLTKAISELGSVDAPRKWVWNFAGYILPGVLISIYSYGLFQSVANKPGSKVPLISFMFSGLFMAFAGIFPGDFDNKQSLTMLLHTVGSFGSYICFLIGAFTYRTQMKKDTYWKRAVVPTLIFTWLTILFGAWPFIFPQTPAVGQRVVFFFYFLWVFYTAIMLLTQERQTANSKVNT